MFSVAQKRIPNSVEISDDDELNVLIRANDIEKIKQYHLKRGKTINKLTFNASVTKMLIDAWNAYYKKYFYAKVDGKSVVLSYNEFLKHFFGKSNRYRYNKVNVHDAIEKKDNTSKNVHEALYKKHNNLKFGI